MSNILKIALTTLGFLFSLTFSFQSQAQFSLRGQIENYNGKDPLNLNIPLVFGYYKSNSILIPVAKDGSFKVEIPLKETKFTNLIFNRRFFQLLLHPGQDLQISLNTSDTSLRLISGSAMPTNKVVQTANIEEYPLFLNKGKDFYSSFSLDQLNQRVVTPYFSSRDEKIERVRQADIGEADKQLITDELIAITYNYLNDLARTESLNRQVIDSLIINVFDQSNPNVAPSGPQFYFFIENYIRYLETKAFQKIKTEHIPSHQSIPYFGISLDSANTFVAKYSKTQWRMLGALKNLPSHTVENYTFQLIANAVNRKEPKQASDLSIAFESQFPTSKFIPEIKKQLKSLQALHVQNLNNKHIEIVNQMEKISSIYEVIKSLKGKVVYLDIWGTWCGPCKAELPYVPALKERFKNEPLAYVYLDMDEDNKDSDWREFIVVNQMEGLHLRKSRKDIAAFWKELLSDAKDKTEYYPQYFIFDKDGKLVITKARRPSETDELYAQITTVLKK